MAIGPRLLYGIYERRLLRAIEGKPLPRHVAVMLDGNRRWAKSVGVDPASGHQAGAENIEVFLSWCEDAGIEMVTLWMLSPDNLKGRSQMEIDALLRIIVDTVERLAVEQRWRLKMVGDLTLLPPTIATRLERAEEATKAVLGLHVNVAVGYGGRDEIAGAVRSLIAHHVAQGTPMVSLAQTITADDIAAHLYTKGQPDPDLVIRTSGEQRLSGFLLWQSVHSEFYFCEAYWPDFRRVDFLRALRDYGQRERRMGR